MLADGIDEKDITKYVVVLNGPQDDLLKDLQEFTIPESNRRVAFGIKTLVAEESSRVAVVKVQRVSDSSQKEFLRTLKFDVDLGVDGDFPAGVDKPFLGESVNGQFKAGETSVELRIDLVKDRKPQPERTFYATLRTPAKTSDYTIGSEFVKVKITVPPSNGKDPNGNTIYAGGHFEWKNIDASGKPAVVVVEEGKVVGGGNGLEIVRKQAAFGEFQVRWALFGDDDGACAKSISPVTDVVQFKDNQTSAFIAINVQDDADPEMTRRCSIKLALSEKDENDKLVAVVNTKKQGQSTTRFDIIENDNARGVFYLPAVVTQVTEKESDTAVTFEARREAGDLSDVRVMCMVRPASAAKFPEFRDLAAKHLGPFDVPVKRSFQQQFLDDGQSLYDGRSSFVQVPTSLQPTQGELYKPFTIAFALMQLNRTVGVVVSKRTTHTTENSAPNQFQLTSFSTQAGNRLELEFRNPLGINAKTTLTFNYPVQVTSQTMSYVAFVFKPAQDLKSWAISAAFNGKIMKEMKLSHAMVNTPSAMEVGRSAGQR